MLDLLLPVQAFAQVVLCVAVADFITGFFHWAEDRYGQPEWPLIGASIIAPNLLHHSKPRAFLENNWYRSADVQLLVALWSTLVLLVVGWLTWRVVLVLALVVNANELHKWAHRTKIENGGLITFLQERHLIISRSAHGRHHGGQRDSHYCSITTWVNPLLDGLKVWRGLEAVIKMITGVSPRRDPAIRSPVVATA
jgi:hypothetical protein